MSNKVHSLLAPSAANRWMACPGSIELSKQAPPQESSSYAAEGSAAHYIAQACLERGQDASEYLNLPVKIGEDTIKVTGEMAEAVQEYLDTVRELLPKKLSSVLNKTFFVEEKFKLPWIHSELSGTSDSIILKKDVLWVNDYKHGIGIVVEPAWNPQLMIYALGALSVVAKAGQNKVKTVRICIVQPRAFHIDGSVRTWDITVEELNHWAVSVLIPATKCTDAEQAPLRVGPHCRFCPALALCPKQIDSAVALAKTDFIAPTVPAPSQLSPEDLCRIIKASGVIGSWVKAVNEYARQQLLAGKRVPGFKLVAGKTNRIWIEDSTETADKLKEHLGEEVYTKKLISVALVEKKLKKLKISSDAVLEGMFTKPEANKVMAPEDDKRREVASSATRDFVETADFLL